MLLKLIKSKYPRYQELGETDAIRPVLRLLYRSRADEALGATSTDLMSFVSAWSFSALIGWLCDTVWDCWAI